MAAPAESETIQFRIPGNKKYVSMVRKGVNSIARGLGFTEGAAADIELSVSEAIANAVEHGSPEHSGNLVVVTCRFDADALTIDVRDEGPGFDPNMHKRDGGRSLAERGRGLKLIYRLMDSVKVSRTRGGSRLRMVKKVESSRRPQHVRFS